MTRQLRQESIRQPITSCDTCTLVSDARATLACDMSFASREKTRLSQWEVNRSLPDAELDGFVEALAIRIASFDKWAISNTKRLVNAASLTPEIEMSAGWDACMASVTRHATQARLKAFRELGFHKPGDTEDRLGVYVGRLNR
jgi:hypothetical protein